VLAVKPRAGLLGCVLGLGLGAGAILLGADALSSSPELSSLEQQAGARSISVKGGHGGVDDLATLAARPLFVLAGGPGAAPETPVRLDGVAIALGRRAALVAVGPKPTQWLTVGQAVDGVKLLEVHPDGAVVDTPTGIRRLSPTGVPSAAAHSVGAPAGVPAGPAVAAPLSAPGTGPPPSTPIRADEPPARPPQR
jgi:hypothetical protein